VLSSGAAASRSLRLRGGAGPNWACSRARAAAARPGSVRATAIARRLRGARSIPIAAALGHAAACGVRQQRFALALVKANSEGTFLETYPVMSSDARDCGPCVGSMNAAVQALVRTRDRGFDATARRRRPLASR